MADRKEYYKNYYHKYKSDFHEYYVNKKNPLYERFVKKDESLDFNSIKLKDFISLPLSAQKEILLKTPYEIQIKTYKETNWRRKTKNKSSDKRRKSLTIQDWLNAFDINCETGEVKSKVGNRIISLKSGYKNAHLKGDAKGCHLLVWMKFNNKEIPAGHHIHHINKNPSDNRIVNLILMEKTDHMKHHKSIN